MSSYLWKYYFEDDVEKFRQVLAYATYNTSASGSRGGPTARGSNSGAIGSTGTSLSTSPSLTTKGKKAQGGHVPNATLSRADLNWKDANGLTLLHYVASSTKKLAYEFAHALLEIPLVDTYIQDSESGWTALHRALYFGNVTIARMLMDRDLQDAVGHTHVGSFGGLIKIKDHEGNSPFDLYGASITSRTIPHADAIPSLSSTSDDDEHENAQGVSGDNEDDGSKAREVAPKTNVDGHEVFAFGSNKNFTLGFGDEDDRQYPERISLKRPEHLLRRLNAEHQVSRSNAPPGSQGSPGSAAVSALPALVQYRPIVIQDVQLSKLHSAVLTTDPEANLYMCGFGKGGRLGTGDEVTRFHYVPVDRGCLAGKRVIHVALGQNHSLAVSSEGEVYAWGSNQFGQLGYATALPSFQNEESIQLLPRQIFGPLKRELIVGTAASGIHSVAYTSVSLFTFGKNAGQLGLVDSDARSLATQNTPRKVASSLFTSPIRAVSAIDKATVCLLENHDIWVLANYGYTKLAFPAEGFSNYFLQKTSSTRPSKLQAEISKITSGGDTICAMSTSGDVFTVHVSQSTGAAAASTSTTNPGKIPRALSPPQRVWSMDRGHMAVTDVDVGQDGSIVICTDSGSVWRRVKRAKIKDTNTPSSADYKSKDYKFSRVPGLTKIVAVRSNAYGGFAAVRKDCDVLQTQVGVDSSSLWKDLYPLLPLQGLSLKEDPDMENPAPRFWVPAAPAHDTSTIRRAVLQASDIEEEVSMILPDPDSSSSARYDLRIGTSLSDVLLPAHEFLLAGRSERMRIALSEFRQSYFFTIPEIMNIEYDTDGKILVQFQGMDLLTVLNLVLYIYTDTVVDVWHHTRQAPKLANRYRQVRLELMKIASSLGLRKLEHAVRVMVEPSKSLHTDLDLAIRHAGYFEHGDVEVELDGSSLRVHQAMVCQRCPFFEGLFHGRAAGAWLSSRMLGLQAPVKVDLKHVDPKIFQLVLQHIYADTDEALFEIIVTDGLDAFLDLIMEVMSVANELMLDRLQQCCQKMLGRFVNTRNVCQLLNAVAPCSVTEFKNAALEYICLNLEGMLENHLLGELDEDLMLELDDVVRENQVACLPFSKSGRAELELFERYPGLVDIIERGRRAKIDSFRLQSRLRDEESYYASASKARPVSRDYNNDKPSQGRSSLKYLDYDLGKPPLEKKTSALDLMFEMEEDDENLVALGEPTTPSHHRTQHGPDERLQAPSPRLSVAETSTNAAASLGASTSPTHRSSSMAHGLSVSPANHIEGAKVWSSSVLSPSRLDMREIMAQASSNKVSSLSSGLANRTSSSGSVAAAQSGKLSQKERKRQAQQQQLHEDIPPVDPAPVESFDREHAPKPSPWRTASSGQKVSLKEILGAETSNIPSPSVEKPRRQASNPPLTMRQTVPGKPSALQRSSSGAAQQNATPRAARSISSPVVSNKNASSHSPSAICDTASPMVQSIRHIPPLAEPSLQLSMTDILSQQQIEKEVISDAVARRSLQEIQEEQAFQEWWDQESKKVREEEEGARGQTASPARGRKNSSRGKGRGTSRGRGRGTGRGGGVETEQPGDSKGGQAEGSGLRGRRSRSGMEPKGRAK